MPLSIRARDWLAQAQDDLRWADNSFQGGFYAQTCFVCQQAAEKALKSMLFARGATAVLSHSLVRLCKQLRINAKLRDAARVLDQYYVSGRYPDAFPEGAPFEFLTKEQAKLARAQARLFVNRAQREVTG